LGKKKGGEIRRVIAKKKWDYFCHKNRADFMGKWRKRSTRVSIASNFCPVKMGGMGFVCKSRGNIQHRKSEPSKLSRSRVAAESARSARERTVFGGGGKLAHQPVQLRK
jgi:hypothetical protein